MEQSGFREYVRIFYSCILGILALFALAMISSFFGSLGGGGLPDEAYGIEALPAFTLPDDPVLEIFVWQKDEAERRKLIALPAGTPIRTGPPVAWSDSGEFASLHVPFEMDGLTLTVSGEGTVTARWEHDKAYDCGFSHTWWYSADPQLSGGLDRTKMHRTHEAKAQAENRLTVLWRGIGGLAADTVTWDGTAAPDARHQIELPQEESAREAGLQRDSVTVLVHLECRNLLGRLEAAATVRLTMQSGWRGAAALWEAERPAVMEAERRGLPAEPAWLDYAIEPPVWTAELIAYAERGE